MNSSRYRMAAAVVLAVMVGACSERPRAVAAQPEARIVWLTDFEQAQRTAQGTGRLILADFSGSDWCGWCMKLDEEVFSRKAFVDYATNAFVMFQADFPQNTELPDATKRQNEALAAKLGVQGFPTVLLLAADGSVVGRTGYQPGGPAAYVAHLKDLAGQGKQ